MHNDSQSDRFASQIKGKAGRLEPLFVAAWIGVAMFSAPLPGQELALDRLATKVRLHRGPDHVARSQGVKPGFLGHRSGRDSRAGGDHGAGLDRPLPR